MILARGSACLAPATPALSSVAKASHCLSLPSRWPVGHSIPLLGEGQIRAERQRPRGTPEEPDLADARVGVGDRHAYRARALNRSYAGPPATPSSLPAGSQWRPSFE